MKNRIWIRILHANGSIGPLCRVPKGFRAPGPRSKISGAPGLQDKNIGAPGLHDISFGVIWGSRLHCDQILRAPGIEIIGAPGSTAKLLGLARAPWIPLWDPDSELLNITRRPLWLYVFIPIHLIFLFQKRLPCKFLFG